jgi:serine/threonine protein kinase
MAVVNVGDVIGGRYRLESVLGQSGMAVVYKGKNDGTLQSCAVKLILPYLVTDAWRARSLQPWSNSSATRSIKVMDFGIAKLLGETHKTATEVGTMAYAASPWTPANAGPLQGPRAPSS